MDDQVSSRRDGTKRTEVLDRLRMAGRRQSTAMVLFHTNVAARLGLGATDEKVLELVARHGALTPKDIAATTGLAPASVSGVLDRLEAKHFVRRERSTDDRRSIRVVPDPEHTRAVGELFGSLMQALGQLYENYSTDDLLTVLGFIEATTAIQERAARELGNPRP